ncbi:PQQ-dependent sugar dehydrogenase [Paenibacillus filicis]|uniref:PQQ-dependent sugar dehydrogenase n=1 Tax=Paenibacillus filicis TaxID=669464 RepID=A0ABU9DDF0_9BACL
MFKAAGMLAALIMTLTTLTGCFEPKSPATGAVVDVVQPSKGIESRRAEPVLETIAEKLKTPWAIDFDGDTIYISEREGDIVKIAGGKTERQKVKLLKPVLQKGEGGFLGFVLAPDFDRSRQAYAYHTYQEKGKMLNRVVLLRQTGNGWQEVKPLLENIPGSIYHNGGRLAIGPDKQLYITTGDAQTESSAQDKKSLAGKILRMTLQGKVPKDNPFPGSYVFSYGHRNSQGIAWDSTGHLYSSEHGPSGSPGGHDEMNLIKPGANYGWPLVIGDEKKEGTEPPLYHTGEKAIAPSGIATDSQDRFLVATLVGETLYRFDPKQPQQLQVVLDKQGRLRDVKVKDGYVYVITNNTDGRGKPGPTDDRLFRFKEQ